LTIKTHPDVLGFVLARHRHLLHGFKRQDFQDLSAGLLDVA
jgi:hypothetical protein